MDGDPHWQCTTCRARLHATDTVCTECGAAEAIGIGIAIDDAGMLVVDPGRRRRSAEHFVAKVSRV